LIKKAMSFVLPLSLIVLLGVVLAAWLMRRRAFEFAAQLKQDALFDKMFRPVAPRTQAKTAAVKPAALTARAPQPTTTPAAAKIHPVTTPLRELAVVIYELHGYQRVHARAQQAPVHFWLHAPGQIEPTYALLEVDCEQPLAAAHLAGLIKRLPTTKARLIVLCKEGFTREAKAMAKPLKIDLITNKTLKRKLEELPAQQHEAVLEKVRRNLSAAAAH
jgi:hypothetical protein